VGLYQYPAYVKTQPYALYASFYHNVQTLEFLKKPLLVILGYTKTMVTNGDDQVFVFLPGGYFDLTAFGRVLDGVINQVI
jgi:hypothetical protein